MGPHASPNGPTIVPQCALKVHPDKRTPHKYRCARYVVNGPVAESVTPNRPALLPPDPSVQHQTTVLGREGVILRID